MGGAVGGTLDHMRHNLGQHLAGFGNGHLESPDDGSLPNSTSMTQSGGSGGTVLIVRVQGGRGCVAKIRSGGSGGAVLIARVHRKTHGCGKVPEWSAIGHLAVEAGLRV